MVDCLLHMEKQVGNLDCNEKACTFSIVHRSEFSASQQGYEAASPRFSDVVARSSRQLATGQAPSLVYKASQTLRHCFCKQTPLEVCLVKKWPLTVIIKNLQSKN